MRRMLTFVVVIAFVIAALFAISAPLHVGYYAHYNAVLREIQKRPPLEAIDGWRNEDVTLEEFGFTIRSPRATLALELYEKGPRLPSDHADGIALRTGAFHRDGNSFGPINAYIRFDSEDWKSRGLPEVRTLAGVLAHFDPIAHSLLTRAPAVVSSHVPGNYITLSPRFRAPAPGQARPEPVSGGGSKLADLFVKLTR